MSTPPVVVEVDPQAMSGEATKPRSGSVSSDSIPEMIMSSSLQSFSESDCDSLSSSVRSITHAQSPRSPRSIFHNYWSSPTRKEDRADSEEDVLARLQTLQLPMPLVDVDEDEGSGSDDREEAKVVHERRPHAQSLDDASIDYQPPARSPTRTARRQILPTPPPQTAISSSLLMGPRRPLISTYGGRKWNSTTALLHRQPQSCLRKSRYSCSAIVNAEAAVTGAARLHHGLRNEGQHDLCGRQESPSREEDLKKSVSFYSHVSVFEFAVPPEQRRSQRGWSDYFA